MKDAGGKLEEPERVSQGASTAGVGKEAQTRARHTALGLMGRVWVQPAWG